MVTQTAPAMGPLARQATRSIIWLMAQSVGSRIVLLATQLVTAALLSPSDFGVVGLAFTVSTIGSAIVGFGVDQVLIRRQRTLYLWVTPAFYLYLALGLAGLSATLLAAPVFASLYHSPTVFGVAAASGLALPFAALSNVPMVLLRSAMRFRTIALIGLGEVFTIQLSTIGLALEGLGAYSFVLPLPIVAAVRLAILWQLAKPSLKGSRRKFFKGRYLVNSSSFVFGASIIQMLVSQGDYMILGILGSPAAVGAYYFSFRLASQPLLLMAGSLTSVLFPALVQIRQGGKAQGRAALKAAKLLGLVIMPLAFAQAAVAKPLVHLFFGPKWDNAIPVMQILSVALGIDAIAWVTGTLLMAQGRLKQQFVYLTIFSPAFFVLAAIGGLNGSAIGLAYGVAVYYIGVTPIYSYVVFRHEGATLMSTICLYVKPAAIAAVAVSIAWSIAEAMWPQHDSMKVVTTVLVSGGLYSAILATCDREGWSEIRTLVRGNFARKPGSILTERGSAIATP